MTIGLGQFHEQQKLVTVAQSIPGKIGVWIAAIGLLIALDVGALMMVALTLVMFFPRWRKALLSLVAIGVLGEGLLEFLGKDSKSDSLLMLISGHWLKLVSMTAAAVALMYVILLAAHRFTRLPRPIRQFPVLTLHGAIWLGLFLSPLPGLGVLSQSPFIIWRLSYLWLQASRGRTADTRFHDHLFYVMPVWGGTSTPYGKGLDYLSRHEARDPEKLARSQLAGLKLLLLGLLWLWALEGIDVAFFGEAGTGLITTRLDAWGADLPRLRTLVRNDVDTSIAAAWAVVYLELVRVTLVLAGAGHVIVGCLRLLGFNVYRNTYKPFLSESIVEFWNRYYYFKEVLVEFFFYPTFVRCAAAGPRLRLFLAVFAAAFAGNMYFHLLAHPGAIVAGDFVLVWETWGSRVFYCFLLASGIWISMLRQKKHRASPPPSGIVRRLARIAFVLSFYALIQIWNVNAHAVGTIERFEFLTSLLGI